MKRANGFALAIVTAPDTKTARKLAQSALEARLIACANLVPGLESHYWWKGAIERGSEVLLILKTRTKQLRALERLILQQHPYETAEFVVLPVTSGTERYLAWWKESVR